MTIPDVTSIDISSMPELAQLAEEVARSGRPCSLRLGAAEVAVLVPSVARPARRKTKALTPAQREAVLATAGAWDGLVDPDELKRRLREAQWDDRPAGAP